MSKAAEIIGWVSIILILSGYVLVSFDAIGSSSPVYQLLNLLGAVGIVITSLTKKDYQPAVLNIIWGAIALFALLKIWL